MGLSEIQRLCTSLSGEAELVLGHVYGLRQWSIYADALVGHHTGAWLPGRQHTAICAVDRPRNFKQTADYLLALGGREEKRHEVADPDCTCGFYAYTDATSLYENSISAGYMAAVFGIIKAHGYVTQGPRGFRAEKAEIVALTYPHADSQFLHAIGSAGDLIPSNERWVPLTDRSDRYGQRQKLERLRDLHDPDLPLYETLDELLAVADPLLEPLTETKDE